MNWLLQSDAKRLGEDGDGWVHSRQGKIITRAQVSDHEQGLPVVDWCL